MQLPLTSPAAMSSASTNILRPDALTQDRPATSGVPLGAVQSADLLQGKKTVEINHNGAIYRLQATKLGKLILTK